MYDVLRMNVSILEMCVKSQYISFIINCGYHHHISYMMIDIISWVGSPKGTHQNRWLTTFENPRRYIVSLMMNKSHKKMKNLPIKHHCSSSSSPQQNKKV
jgi:hypothetical protein